MRTATSTSAPAAAPITNSSSTPSTRPPATITTAPEAVSPPCRVSNTRRAPLLRPAARHGHGPEHLLEHVRRAQSCELRFGRHHEAMREHWLGEGLDVIGHDIVSP